MATPPSLLRAARLDVARQFDDLAPDLRRHPGVLLMAARAAISEQGLDPDTVSPPDMNRLERHAIVTNLGAKQKDLLVEGTLDDAHFKRVWRTPQTYVVGRQATRLAPDIRNTLRHGHNALARRHLVGGRQQRWWGPVANRYQNLGTQMVAIVDDPKPYIRAESRTLRGALTSNTLGVVVSELSLLVDEQYDADQGALVAHGLSHLPTSLAGGSLREFALGSSLYELNGEIVETGVGYAIDRKTSGNWHDVFYRDNSASQVTTMKCPYHTSIEVGQSATTLTDLVHATINAAVDYGMFTDG